MSYENLAYYYDSMMDPQFYEDYLAFILDQCDFNNVLELGCGTGEISIALARLNKEVYATDISEDMLKVFVLKTMFRNLPIENYRVDMTDFEIDEAMDLILCLCDSINYILDLNDVRKVFINTYNALKKGGCFIFDIDSLYKMNVILKDYFEEEEEDFFFSWKVRNIESGYVEHHIEIIDEENDQHFKEVHLQRTYHHSVYYKMLEEVGFTDIRLFSDFEEFKEECERIIFVCFKGGQQ